MQTTAHFAEISTHIQKQLKAATQHIYIAVAWFTDNEMLHTLCQKAKEGVVIQLMIANDAINREYGADFERLEKAGGKVWWVGNGAENEILMHNKFCVIDGCTVLTGSYNWSKKAKQNHENITIIEGDNSLAEHYLAEFEAIQKRYFGEEAIQIDYSKIHLRLEAIRQMIRIGDTEDIDLQAKKLNTLLPESFQDVQVAAAKNILDKIYLQKYGEVMTDIDDFLNRFQQLATYIDPEMASLQLEIQSLELQIATISNEKADIEKLIHDFSFQYTQELGELIQELLFLRKEKARKEKDKRVEEMRKVQAEKEKAFEEAKKAYEEAKQKADEAEFASEEAEKEYEDFHQQYEENQQVTFQDLTEEQKKELKKKYKRAVLKCHPDRVAPEFQAQAEEIFKELSKAYQENDLQRVSDILEELENGNLFFPAHSIQEKDKLMGLVVKLREKLAQLVLEIEGLRENDTYQVIAGLENWEAYFTSIRMDLEEEIRGFDGLRIE